MHVATHGAAGGPALVLLHGLGQDGGIWADVADAMPRDLHVLRPDLRGHGASPVPDPPYAMGRIVGDLERSLAAHGVRDAVVAGLGLGGMVAQALAVKRLDLVRALVLVNSAPKIGTPDGWRAEAERRDRIPEGADPRGYAGTCAALAGTDLMAATATLRLPALILSGTRDRTVPPDLAQEAATLIPGAETVLLRGAGHDAPREAPQDVARVLMDFLARIGHLSSPAEGQR
ncbi:alpha/beta fold hydrolase [Palleronia sp. THAF1]|uniref:alpha/beta fold hydrolase n=1 Tax=Palleronia sp. THAF1 TaxID=2587842 RepID=UPI0015626D07|nr:alpha/beta fold hydrolase [Palleronia sp. THAF1]